MMRDRFCSFPSPWGGGVRGEGGGTPSKFGSCAKSLSPTLSPGEREQNRPAICSFWSTPCP